MLSNFLCCPVLKVRLYTKRRLVALTNWRYVNKKRPSKMFLASTSMETMKVPWTLSVHIVQAKSRKLQMKKRYDTYRPYNNIYSSWFCQYVYSKMVSPSLQRPSKSSKVSWNVYVSNIWLHNRYYTLVCKQSITSFFLICSVVFIFGRSVKNWSKLLSR